MLKVKIQKNVQAKIKIVEMTKNDFYIWPPLLRQGYNEQ